jgi:hypothetical protein
MILDQKEISKYTNQCFNCSNYRPESSDCIQYKINVHDLTTVISLLMHVYPKGYNFCYKQGDDDKKTNLIIKRAIYRLLEINNLEVNETSLNDLIRYNRRAICGDEIEIFTDLVAFFKCKLFNKKQKK